MKHLIIPTVVLLCLPALAQEPVSDIEQLSLEELLASPIEVATHTPETTRDVPSIVTVVPRDEIAASGARDLMDILHLVPGFSFGLDVQGVVSAGFRGLWGHEGKILLLIDGQPLNEILYSSIQLGQHVPADIIERVEIIRGPGSAIYGGFAELAVINVVTRSPNGLNVSQYVGQQQDGFGRAITAASYGQQIRDLRITVQGAFGEGQRSDGTYTDYSGASYPMNGNSRLGTAMVNVGATWRDLRLRFLFDDHNIETRDGSGPVLISAALQRFQTIVADAQYDARLHRRVVLTPRLHYKYQLPWNTTDKSSEIFFDKSAHRLRGNLTLSIDAGRGFNILAGVDGYWDHGRVNDPTITGYQTLFGGTDRTVSYYNLAAFAQVIWRNRIVNVTAGARYEYNSYIGNSLVPRVGLTKVWRNFNFKLLFSEAFRAPGIENINLAVGPIKAERTDVAEAEVGYQLGRHHLLTANAFWVRIRRPIVYDVDPAAETEAYFNSGSVGTAGVEAEYRFKYTWGFATLNYSFYSSAGQSDSPSFAVPGVDYKLLAFPSHKVALNSGFNLWRDHLSLNVSAVLMTKRNGYVEGDGAGNGVLGNEPTTFLLNAFFVYRNLGVPGLDLGVGAFNLTGQRYRFVQPYNGGHAPLPGWGREYFIRLSFNASFDGT